MTDRIPLLGAMIGHFWLVIYSILTMPFRYFGLLQRGPSWSDRAEARLGATYREALQRNSNQYAT